MFAADFDYELPEEAIATSGVEPRDSARLLVDDPTGLVDRRVRDLDTILHPGDVLVVNDTKVLPARVRFTRPSGGAAEVLLLEPTDDGWWQALVRPSAKIAPGSVLSVDETFAFEFGADLGEGRRLVAPLLDGRPASGSALLDALERVGEMPLPPYLGSVHLDDPDRYQTVFAARAASAAAPTAGLHLTLDLLDRIRARGVDIARVELVVGLGTFRPMTAERVEDHVMHHESYRVPAATWSTIEAARADGRRVVAVGTTAVRAVESVAATGELAGSTDLFIRHPYEWQVVDALMTNFHLPRSSLLVMIDAFVGPRWREIYATALDRGYRFLSFGDAVFLERTALLERAGDRS
ncbi:MAG: tRNA preQ1(34) S-adenosylmethionine ribosyltransferase-isomerase QueA [Acidimicrobiales bacterium]